MVLLLYAGYFKANPLLSAIPVDLTLFAAIGALVGIVVCYVSRGGDAPLRVGGIALALAFVPGVLLASDTAYALEKVDRLSLTAIAGVSAMCLIGTERRQAVFVGLNVLVGVLIALGTLAAPAPETETVRISLDGADTIATGRAIGVAIVVLIVVAMTRARLRVAAIIVAAGLSYFLVGTGSRGPLLAVFVVVVAIAAVIPTRGRGSRLALIAATTASLAVLVFVVDESGSNGADRIRDTLAGKDTAGEGRFAIWHDALASIAIRPEGVGWGDFWTVLTPGARHTTTFVQYAHNIVLESAVEGGWLAGAAVIVFIVLSLNRLRHAQGPVGYAVLAVAFFYVVNAFVSGDVNDNRTMWATLALGWAGTKTARRNGEQAHGEVSVFSKKLDPTPREEDP